MVLYRLAVAWTAAAHSHLALLPAVENNFGMRLVLLGGCFQWREYYKSVVVVVHHRLVVG